MGSSLDPLDVGGRDELKVLAAIFVGEVGVGPDGLASVCRQRRFVLQRPARSFSVDELIPGVDHLRRDVDQVHVLSKEFQVPTVADHELGFVAPSLGIPEGHQVRFLVERIQAELGLCKVHEARHDGHWGALGHQWVLSDGGGCNPEEIIHRY